MFRPPRWVAPLGLWGVGLLWAAALLFLARRFMVEDRAALARAADARLLSQAAAVLGEPRGDPAARVRWLGGEPDARFAAYWPRRGAAVTSGPAPVPPPPEWLRRNSPTMVPDPEDPSAVVFLAPVWVDGRRAGLLAWGRWPAPASDRAAARDRALAVSFLWWAAAGALALLGFHRLAALSGRPPLDNPPFER